MYGRQGRRAVRRFKFLGRDLRTYVGRARGGTAKSNAEKRRKAEKRIKNVNRRQFRKHGTVEFRRSRH